MHGSGANDEAATGADIKVQRLALGSRTDLVSHRAIRAVRVIQMETFCGPNAKLAGRSDRVAATVGGAATASAVETLNGRAPAAAKIQ